MELIGGGIQGIYRDILIGADNKVLFDRRWARNTIVDGYRRVLARFMNNHGAITGIQSLHVGRGDDAWDAAGAPTPDPKATAGLVKPHGVPVTVDNPPAACSMELKYIDESADGSVTTNITSRLQITAKLGPGYPAPEDGKTSFPLREFGLFGTVDNQNYMINCIRHPVIHKDVNATLIRIVRLYF